MQHSTLKPSSEEQGDVVESKSDRWAPQEVSRQSIALMKSALKDCQRRQLLQCLTTSKMQIDEGSYGSCVQFGWASLALVISSGMP